MDERTLLTNPSEWADDSFLPVRKGDLEGTLINPRYTANQPGVLIALVNWRVFRGLILQGERTYPTAVFKSLDAVYEDGWRPSA